MLLQAGIEWCKQQQYTPANTCVSSTAAETLQLHAWARHVAWLSQYGVVNAMVVVIINQVHSSWHAALTCSHSVAVPCHG